MFKKVSFALGTLALAAVASQGFVAAPASAGGKSSVREAGNVICEIDESGQADVLIVYFVDFNDGSLTGGILEDYTGRDCSAVIADLRNNSYVKVLETNNGYLVQYYLAN